MRTRIWLGVAATPAVAFSALFCNSLLLGRPFQYRMAGFLLLFAAPPLFGLGAMRFRNLPWVVLAFVAAVGAGVFAFLTLLAAPSDPHFEGYVFVVALLLVISAVLSPVGLLPLVRKPQQP